MFGSGHDEGRAFADSEPDAEGDGREPGPEPVDGRGDAVDDDARPRRRRRRGRRGGRGRGRGDADPEQPARTQPRDAPAAEADEDPVPTAYGMRAPARTGDSRDDAPRPAAGRDADDAADGRGRRRRRRGGEGRSRAAAGGESDRGRRRGRDRRKGSRDSRSTTLSRGRRDDFAPVAGRHDEDDEGLEFLGVEEAGQDAPRRRAPEDDEILAESGLSSVLDVPSWVEAIGIVIAGNLDARTKGRGSDRSR